MFWAHLSEPSLFFTLVRAQLPLPPPPHLSHAPSHAPIICVSRFGSCAAAIRNDRTRRSSRGEYVSSPRSRIIS